MTSTLRAGANAVAARAFRTVSGQSLAAFRVLFGLIMLVEVLRFWTKGWIHEHYLLPRFLFTYSGFDWIAPWPGEGLYWHFIVLGIAALCIAVGAFYRIAAIVFFFGFTYVFLLDQARYLNHFYLVILISFLMIFLPANRMWAVDAWLFPRLRDERVPMIAVWTLRGQMEVMLLYAGLVKLNPDWLRLEPLRIWLSERPDFPLMGHLFTETWVVMIGNYGVTILHIVGAPLLFWRRTRLAVFVVYCGFHLMNHFMFTIGIFPWLAMAGTLIFFDPDWPGQLVRRIRTAFSGARPAAGEEADRAPRPAPEGGPSWVGRAALAGLAIWLALQVAIPLRHFAYPGRPSWTEEGHRFAWQMMLRRKKGEAHFQVRDPATGEVWWIDNHRYLTRRQVRKMAGNPEMIIQFAHHLRDVWIEHWGVANPEVRVNAMVSLNGRRRVPMIDPDRDLSKERWGLAHSDWILPLTEPLHSVETLAQTWRLRD